MDAQKADRWAGLEPPMLDTLASQARTALDDPGALGVWIDMEDERKKFQQQGEKGYVIDKLDELMDLLNPSLEVTETFATTFTVLGRHLADRVSVMESLAQDDGDEPWGEAIDKVSAALDLIDEAIASLRPEPVYSVEVVYVGYHGDLRRYKVLLDGEYVAGGLFRTQDAAEAFIAKQNLAEYPEV